MNRHMKTATLIALVCSVVFSSPLRMRETKPDFSPDRMERKLNVAGESPGKAVAKSAADDEKAHFLKRQTANRNTVIAFGVFASALGLLLLSELLRAPQGYKGDVGFHFGKPFPKFPVQGGQVRRFPGRTRAHDLPALGGRPRYAQTRAVGNLINFYFDGRLIC